MSGIATQTNQMIKKIPKNTKLYATRKTAPGLRYFDKEAVEITNIRREAYEENCPLVWGRKQDKCKWWTKELTMLKREAAKLRVAYRRTGGEELKEEKNRAQRKYRNRITDTKFEAWKKFCKEMENKSAVAKLQSLMKNGKVNKVGTLRRKDGSCTATPKETLEELLNTLFPDDPEYNRDEINNINMNNDLTEEQIETMINETTVTEAMRNFKPYKSPGVDGIYPIMIQQGLAQLEPRITELYKESIRQGRPAKCWMKIKAVYIPKQG